MSIPGTVAEGYSTFLQWWTFDKPAPSGWDGSAFCTAILLHAADTWGTVLRAVGPSEEIVMSIYWGSSYLPAGTRTGSGSFFYWTVGDILPMRNAAVIRRELDTYDRRKDGRFFMSGIPKFWQENGILTHSAINDLQAVCDAWNTDFVDQGVTYSPSLVRYSDATITRISKLRVQARMGHVMRRAGRFRIPHPIPLSPKAPPP